MCKYLVYNTSTLERWAEDKERTLGRESFAFWSAEQQHKLMQFTFVARNSGVGLVLPAVFGECRCTWDRTMRLGNIFCQMIK